MTPDNHVSISCQLNELPQFLVKKHGFLIWSFILIINWLLFSVIGYILFSDQQSEDFRTIPKSLESVFVLSVACNFPDTMIKLFHVEEIKFLAIFYFLIYKGVAL